MERTQKKNKCQKEGREEGGRVMNRMQEGLRTSTSDTQGGHGLSLFFFRPPFWILICVVVKMNGRFSKLLGLSLVLSFISFLLLEYI